MKKKKYQFREYMDASNELFKKLFGEEEFKKLERKHLNSIDWNGIDLHCSSITATFPDIKDRFNEEWIDYFKDKEISLFELFLQSVFHYGYQQADDHFQHELIQNKIIMQSQMISLLTTRLKEVCDKHGEEMGTNENMEKLINNYIKNQ